MQSAVRGALQAATMRSAWLLANAGAASAARIDGGSVLREATRHVFRATRVWKLNIPRVNGLKVSALMPSPLAKERFPCECFVCAVRVAQWAKVENQRPQLRFCYNILYFVSRSQPNARKKSRVPSLKPKLCGIRTRSKHLTIFPSLPA